MRGPLLKLPMLSRDVGEHHRAATPLELFFDLCFVVAVAQAVAGLHHAAVEGHFVEGISRYAIVFFAIWWPWVNFTWFASAFDTDDIAYRIAVLVQIGGNLTIAAGIPRIFSDMDPTIGVIGYVIMRVAVNDRYRSQSAAGCVSAYPRGIRLSTASWSSCPKRRRNAGARSSRSKSSGASAIASRIRSSACRVGIHIPPATKQSPRAIWK